MRRLKLPIPTNIITGSLGVGKTTALCKLVSRKPANEYWCVIVNEFGAVGIDAVALQSSAAAAGGTVTVKQIAGGCMCCAQSGVLLPAIAQIIRQTKPDRLLIEPSGLGHPAGLLDILQGPHLGSSLQLNAIVCLVDLSTFDPTQLAKNPTAWDQLNIADILVGSKVDAADSAAVEAFQTWASEELFPPKSQVLLSANGDLDPVCLQQPRSAAAAAGLLLKTSASSSRARQQQRRLHPPDSTSSNGPFQLPGSSQDRSSFTDDQIIQGLQNLSMAESAEPVDVTTAFEQQPQPSRPQRVMGQSANSSSSGSSSSSSSGVTGAVNGQAGNTVLQQLQQHNSCGWVFHESDVFCQAELLRLLHALQPVVARVKGVFRVGPKQWVMPAAAATAAADAGAATPATAAQPGDMAGLQSEQGTNNSTSSSSSSSTLLLQEVCYRGPSMVEVILPHGDQQALQAAAAAAAAAAAVLMAVQPTAANGAISAASACTADGVWLHLEAALQACLKPTTAA